jgi:hypothetical protein
MFLHNSSMATMSPQQFIQQVLMSEIRDVIYTHKYHYLSFGLVCNGIEFLGKCVDQSANWRTTQKYGFHFKQGLKLMPGYSKFETDLYEGLRCGFAHGLVPGKPVALTHRDEAKKQSTRHLVKDKTRLILVIEDFYDDFFKACETVLSKTFPVGDKMTRGLLYSSN